MSRNKWRFTEKESSQRLFQVTSEVRIVFPFRILDVRLWLGTSCSGLANHLSTLLTVSTALPSSPSSAASQNRGSGLSCGVSKAILKALRRVLSEIASRCLERSNALSANGACPVNEKGCGTFYHEALCGTRRKRPRMGACGHPGAPLRQTRETHVGQPLVSKALGPCSRPC